MPRPTHKGSTYLPALDGLRALAVGFVVLYHLHVPGFSSGLLGVGVFFTLSGFLITSLLLATRARTGGFELKRFWLARARRLIPAVLLVLGTSLIAAAIAMPDKLAKFSWQALSALFYVNNWYNIGSSDSYFDRFSGPGPFDHLWSLSIEEQFYLFWPLLLGLLLLVFKKRIWVTLVILALALVSFLLLNGVAHAGFDNTRAYEGTDTRAGGLLLGAALAFWWPARARTVSHNQRCTIDVFALAGLGLMVYLIATTPDGSLSLYQNVIALLSIATVAVLIATVVPESLVATVLAIPPLRWIGERSYGIYLWHMPIIAFMPATFRSEKPVTTGIIVVVTTLILSSLSWRYVEDPIRRQGFRKAFTTPRDPEDTLMNHFLAWLIALTTRFTGWLDALQQRVEARAAQTATPEIVTPDTLTPDTAGPLAQATSSTAPETVPATSGWQLGVPGDTAPEPADVSTGENSPTGDPTPAEAPDPMEVETLSSADMPIDVEAALDEGYLSATETVETPAVSLTKAEPDAPADEAPTDDDATAEIPVARAAADADLEETATVDDAAVDDDATIEIPIMRVVDTPDSMSSEPSSAADHAPSDTGETLGGSEPTPAVGPTDADTVQIPVAIDVEAALDATDFVANEQPVNDAPVLESPVHESPVHESPASPADAETARIPVAPPRPGQPPHGPHGPAPSTPSLRRRRRQSHLIISIVVVAALAVGGLVALGGLHADTPDSLDNASLAEDLPTTPSTRPAGPLLPVTQRRTSCTTVIHIGDSTSIGMNDPDNLPNPADRIAGRYRAVGAKNVITDIQGARSSLELVNGEPNAVTAIQGHLARGERGCWVMAMGINDTANVEVGGQGPVDMRIDRLLGPLKDEQVLWPTVITSPLNQNPAYNNAAMQRFNKALLRACKRYPNLRLYNWAAEARPDWFSDGIHYTPAGYIQRAYRFSIALASVFPATDAPPQGCLLESSGVQTIPPSPTPRPAPTSPQTATPPRQG
ncbi:acyltransferase family protein [Gordonia sp. VNQ95]|jgi:peptidoglycan/LPS O-acetylase OafA/YrhL|uniref:acyltransferase family protein n=1 Tax=Gordonia sp. VNQ95 TaxID=3156619 RepID=UPI0032B35FD9